MTRPPEECRGRNRRRGSDPTHAGGRDGAAATATAPAAPASTDMGARGSWRPPKPGRGGAGADALFVDRMALRLDDLATALGVSRRAVERERSAGRLPKPDRVIGRMPLWSVETIRRWLGEDAR